MFSDDMKKLGIDLEIPAEGTSFNILENSRWENAEAEGQLAVDVAQTESELIVIAALAGASLENLEIHLHNDLLTIRGERRSPADPSAEHFYQECFWGKF